MQLGLRIVGLGVIAFPLTGVRPVFLAAVHLHQIILILVFIIIVVVGQAIFDAVVALVAVVVLLLFDAVTLDFEQIRRF